jgi:mono/diheme cytochrome c family protein
MHQVWRMQRRAATLVVLLAAAFGFELTATAVYKFDIEDIRPGLVATYTDPGAENATITKLEPTIALVLGNGEAAHPRLSASGGMIRWQGYINILRAGPYRFSANLRGKVSVSVADQQVFAADVPADAPALKTGAKADLKAGIQPFAVEFTRSPGVARLELMWEGPDIYREPLSYTALFHLGSKIPPQVAANQHVDMGRFLAEEHSCVRCHAPGTNAIARGLDHRQGPNLTDVGKRTYPGWIYQWLQNPHQVYADAVMPQMFGTDEVGKTEAYAVAKFLTSLAGPLDEEPGKLDKVSVDRGRILFTSVGCVVCHGSPTEEAKANGKTLSFYPAAVSQFSLRGIAGKTTPKKLADYLKNPHATDPGGRMPSMLLTDQEARDLANFLCGDKTGVQPKDLVQLPEPPANALVMKAFQKLPSRPEDMPAFQKLEPEKQLIDLGQRLVLQKNCAACHNLEIGGKQVMGATAKGSFDDIAGPKSKDLGCLAFAGDKRGAAPSFQFTDGERKQLDQFLRQGTAGPGSPSPTYKAHVSLQRFRCLNCHDRDGEGGLTESLVEELKRYEKAENAEAVLPPQLTGVGHKLRTSWLTEVLLKGGRARPWMSLRMPQFGEAHVGHLPAALAHLEGTQAYDKIDTVTLSNENIAAGRFMTGKSGFGCISCHDIAGIPNFGTRGPDLATTIERVQYDWYRRWMQQAQRMDPGTKMPTAFPDGKSTLLTVLHGDADAQAEAIWAYMSLGPKLPLPEGVQKTQKGLILTVKSQPSMLRTFMPNSGTKAIVTGYPAGISASFDAQKCRLAYAWTGDFLDVSPVWNNRGGAPARILGEKFVEFPDGCPWALTDSEAVPDLVERGKDPAFGANLPEGQVYLGERHLSFTGYGKDKLGQPAFRYEIDAPKAGKLKVEEKPLPLLTPAATGLARRFSLDVPEQGNLWFLAYATNNTPKIIDASGESPRESSDKLEFSAAKYAIVIPQGNQSLVLNVPKTGKDWTWRLRQDGGTWQVLLHRVATKGQTQVQVNLWSPHDNDAAALKKVLATE